MYAAVANKGFATSMPCPPGDGSSRGRNRTPRYQERLGGVSILRYHFAPRAWSVPSSGLRSAAVLRVEQVKGGATGGASRVPPCGCFPAATSQLNRVCQLAADRADPAASRRTFARRSPGRT